MTIASKGSIGSFGDTTNNQASIALTTATTNLAVGDLAIIAVACDNTATTDTDGGKVTGVTDSVGNTWSKALEFTNGQGAAQAGAVCSVWYSQLTVALPTGSTVTAALGDSANNDATAIAGWGFSCGTVEIEATNSVADDGASQPSSLDATTENVACLRTRFSALEQGSASLANTPTTDWTAITGASSAALGTGEMSIRGEFLISTGTGAASAPTFQAGVADSASVYVAFRELPSGGGFLAFF